jgi:hypothetical protein
VGVFTIVVVPPPYLPVASKTTTRIPLKVETTVDSLEPLLIALRYIRF